MSRTVTKPRLPAAARKAGATVIDRCSERTFRVSFKLTDESFDAPGNGFAVLAALKSADQLGEWSFEWAGRQAAGIIMTARA